MTAAPASADMEAGGGGHIAYKGKTAREKLELFFLDAGALAVFVLSLYVTLGVVSRSVIGTAIPDETVVVAEMMLAAVALPLAFVAAERAFITVDIFTSRLYTIPLARAALDTLASLVGLSSVVLILYAGWGSFLDAYRDGDYYFGLLSVPEWPGKLVFLCGYIVFVLRLVTLLLGDFLRLARGGDADTDAQDAQDAQGGSS